ncbi:hypothetical protein ZIOFF_053653 [Zingiber officinale]|uniref:Pectinesterase n=1 Tax=Zingiber officinale TaxID=94328 RepID=A0A8J5FCM9_ZINOF|nr:hypothetical protein ZIOFF_053653 [Zingiber officinale]
MRDVTVENSAGPSKHQAVALRVGADLSAFHRCSFVGNQDTLYVHSLRQFFYDCDVYGTIDFIFGNSAVVLQKCRLYARRPLPGQQNFFTAQAREDPNQNTGISVHRCQVKAAADLLPVQSSFLTYLGRPWREYSRTVFMKSFLDSLIDPAGWSEWDGSFALSTLFYGEYKNSGPGATTTGRVKWPGYRIINSSTEAKAFTLKPIAFGIVSSQFNMHILFAYIKKAACIGLRSNRNDDLENGVVEGRPISQGKEIFLEEHLLQAAHRYVLFNTVEIDPYIQMHIEELKQTDRRFSNRIQWLAHGPRKHVISYTGYIINGHRFHTIDVGRSTQHSGVSVEADTIWQSSSTNSHTIGRLSYYGVIRDIVLLDYYFFKVPVFRCDWANPGTGIKMDDGFTLVNLHQGLRTFENDPFILASQAKQVFYSRENDESNWYVLLKAPPRGIHNMDLLEEDAYTSSKPLDVSRLEINITEKEPYSRNECEGIDVIDIP